MDCLVGLYLNKIVCFYTGAPNLFCPKSTAKNAPNDKRFPRYENRDELCRLL